MNKNTLMLAAAAAAGAAAILLAPTAAADDAVFIGGTGTGIVPQGDPTGLVQPFVPNIDHLTDVQYNGSPVANPSDGVPIALDAVRGTEGPTTIVGLSKGAQVAHGVEAQDTRTDTKYVLIGDPDDDHGISRQFGLSGPKRDFTHDVNIVVGEYDGVGDMPDRFNPLASLNAIAGWAFVHTQYGNGTADDPLTHLNDAKVSTSKNPNGTTKTRTVIPTAHLPLLKPLRDTELTLTHQTRLTDSIEKALKPHIDAGYSRNDTKDGNKVEPATKASDTSKTSKDKAGSDSSAEAVSASSQAVKTGSESEGTE
ncbi:membrane protein [Mycobacterium phage Steamy]|uniref:Membrane protein n=1 Tax=Mycobacterium phage Steamy TaxID=2250309 RepID=A0A345L0P4_9CAUD|nr:DNA binding protein [Mycobacterium phage Steamy]AXH48846.1 membrane protein [Mycobacterium phage Steamy]